MNNQQFFQSFNFRRISFNRNHHTDNYTNQGARTNFIGQLIKGSAKLVSKSETILLKENDIFYIPKGCHYHSYWYTNENTELEWYSLGFDFLPHENNGNYTLQKIIPNLEGSHMLQKLVDDLTVNATTIGYLYCFLGNVLPCMARSDKPYELLTEKAVEYMRKHSDFKMCDVAEYCNVSEASLYSIFKKHMGRTPNEIRQKIICEKAEELLITTTLTVEEISGKLGFSSSSYFRKILKKHTNLSPKEIRQNSYYKH
ncbi:MAG: AraC family transcriptional regulator [Tyzzerella sp.]|nr:AraC family transcriptional regulator [Tyzzerella sp.]